MEGNVTDKLNAALRYISRGWHVFPLNGIVDGRCSCGRPSCDRGGKHPFKGTHGFKEASNDPAQITLWWTRRPYANMGVALEASGLQLLDVDPRNGGDATFEALPEELKAQIGRTLTAETGGGGWHYIFRCNGTNPIGKVKGGAIDVRQVGYFIAAPSSHISGKTYRWVDEAQEPTDPPESLVVEAKEAGPRPLPRDPGRGEQNDALCSLAGTLRRRGMDEGQIYGQLTEYSREWSPPAREAKIREIARWVSQKAVGTDWHHMSWPRRLAFACCAWCSTRGRRNTSWP